MAYVRGNVRLEDLPKCWQPLANASGGMIVIGINPRNLRPEGVVDGDQMNRMVLDAAALCAPTLVIPMPLLIEHATVMVVVVLNVPGGSAERLISVNSVAVTDTTRVITKTSRSSLMHSGACLSSVVA
jgi:hypothetical protein